MTYTPALARSLNAWLWGLLHETDDSLIRIELGNAAAARIIRPVEDHRCERTPLSVAP
jgi:hypothetical protein